MSESELPAPDIAGERPTCPDCGTSVAANSPIQITCPCGRVLEAWPVTSGG